MRCEDDDCSCCGVDRGPQGLRGFQGSNNLQGPQGTVGFQSEVVILGAQGPQGPQGFMIVGERGSQGLQGEETAGPQGPIGKKGLENIGVQGSQGSPGFDGPQGVMSIGPKGPQGFASVGSQGYQGPTGFQNAIIVGPQGPAGQQPSLTTTIPITIQINANTSPTYFSYTTFSSFGTYIVTVNGSVECNDPNTRNFTLQITGNSINEVVTTTSTQPITTFNLQTRVTNPSTASVLCSITATPSILVVVRSVMQVIKMT